MTIFQQELKQLINKKIIDLKEEGIISMGIDNMWQLLSKDIGNLKGAPKGTNCQYIARDTFNEIADLNKFLY